MSRDLLDWALLRRAVRLRGLQFLLILPSAGAVAVVLLSAAVGIEHPSFNFGTVFTWVVWWGVLLLSLVLIGRAWCVTCPIGAVGEWIQRLAFWGRPRLAVGYDVRWPRALRGMWLPTALFLAFVWLDNGYGLANSPRLTAGLIAVLVLASAWTGLVFERRAFCRYLCPLTAFIGLGSLVSMVELRRRDAGVCRARCAGKDCYRGNARQHGCPMSEFPGGGMDTNLNCILCTECLKSCPYDNIGVRLRVPGRDLWRMRRFRFDAAVAAAAVVGLATVLPLMMSELLPPVRGLLAGVLPAGTPPNDPPRLVAVSALFLAGLGASVALVGASSRLSRWAAGSEAPPAATLFAGYAYGLIPLGLAKFLADFLDHALRTGGALVDVTRALLVDFPLNRAVPGAVTVLSVSGPVATYLLQVGILLAGLVLALVALDGISRRLFAGRDAALASLLPMAGLAAALTLVSLWTLGMPLL